MNLLDVIQERRSEREFSQDNLNDKEIALLQWSFWKVPSAGALYPLSLAIIRNTSPTLFIICADFKKTTKKYGKRGVRYVYMEAGHAAQNLCLVATSLGLASYCIGYFDEKSTKERIGKGDKPVYIVAIGRKK